MSSEPDLHRAISMRPLPFNHGFRQESLRPSEPSYHQSSSDAIPILKSGTSTAVEAGKTDDPVARHGHRGNADIELQTIPTYTIETDPYKLASKIKTADEMAQIRANSSRKRDGFGPLKTNKTAYKARKIEKFYEAQNENIETLLKPVDDHRRLAKEEEGANHLKFKIAVQGSFIANVLLAGLQLYGAASSGSLSLFTTMVDSVFDPLSNVTLILCNRAVKRVDGRRFPSGKARIETAGNIFFCFLMCAVSAIIIVESIRELATYKSSEDTKSLHLPSIIAVAVAFVTKFCLFLYCWALRNKYSQIRILWEDHRNDLFINGLGILTSVGGSKLRWWIDPMGAIILSTLIIFLWLRTAYSEFQLLIGVTADTHMLQLITYICTLPRLPILKHIYLMSASNSNDPLATRQAD
jgi:cation diffusion facilitator family transporter